MSDQASRGETSQSVSSTPQFEEFPAPTYEEWRTVAEASLKGASFDKVLLTNTYEGITLHPIYRREDAVNISHQHTLPGFPPYVRGASATGYLEQAWEVAQEIPYSTPGIFNEALHDDLLRGQTAVNLLLDQPTRAGIDPDQAEPGAVGRGGLSLASVADVLTALKGVDLESVPLFIRVGTAAIPLTALLIAGLRRDGVNITNLSGCIETDPLGVIAHQGSLPVSLDRAYTEMAQLTTWAQKAAPELDTIAVHNYPYHNSGAHAVQELGFALATGVSYLREMLKRGLDLEAITTRMRFMFSVGGNFFMEVAKLRAARIVWSQAVTAFGGSAAASQMTLHARTATRNKTLYDPYVNMLRTTIEAFAGAVGGVNSMHVAPFDESLRPPDSFSRRIARNQQLILRDECHLDRLIDPSGGSWYIEVLTDELAKRGWALFQRIEKHGGMFAAMETGFVQDEIAQVAAQRFTNLARRKDVLVGTNMYPNLDEAHIPTNTLDYEAITKERKRDISDYRSQSDISIRASALDKLQAATKNLVEIAVDAAHAGATLNEIALTLRSNDDQRPSITPVKLARVSEPIEALRKAAETYAVEKGQRPQVFLANMGPIPQHKARADFATGFYQVGGFEILTNTGFDTPEAAAQAALESDASVVVICSTDATYPDVVPPIVKTIKAAKPEVVVILAGYPKDQVEAHKVAGIDDFIHIRANCYEMNKALHDQLGIGN